MTNKINRMILIINILALLFFVSAAIPAMALVFGGSNLGFSGYPEHSCHKPIKPSQPFTFQSQWEVDIYNSSVDTYNSKISIYINCIQGYIDNAKNDIGRIKAKINDAISEARS
jgi:hypothetical protein